MAETEGGEKDRLRVYQLTRLFFRNDKRHCESMYLDNVSPLCAVTAIPPSHAELQSADLVIYRNKGLFKSTRGGRKGEGMGGEARGKYTGNLLMCHQHSVPICHLLTATNLTDYIFFFSLSLQQV